MPSCSAEKYKLGEKSAWLGIVANFLLFTVKLAGGIIGRSQAMVADALHTASDSLTSIGVLVGFRIAAKPPDVHHPFGHGRAESIMAKLIAMFLIAVGLGIAYRSVVFMIKGNFEAPGRIALTVSVLSIAVKEILYRKVFRASVCIKSSSLKADAHHHRSDAISSVAALLGIASARMGVPFMDPLAGVVVSGFIIKMGVVAFHEAYDELMDAAPPEGLRRDIEKCVAASEGVLEVKRIMVRKAGIDLYPEITIGVQGEQTVTRGHIITMKVKRDLFKCISGIKDVIIHVEPLSGTAGENENKMENKSN